MYFQVFLLFCFFEDFIHVKGDIRDPENGKGHYRYILYDIDIKYK